MHLHSYNHSKLVTFQIGNYLVNLISDSCFIQARYRVSPMVFGGEILAKALGHRYLWAIQEQVGGESTLREDQKKLSSRFLKQSSSQNFKNLGYPQNER